MWATFNYLRFHRPKTTPVTMISRETEAIWVPCFHRNSGNDKMDALSDDVIKYYIYHNKKIKKKSCNCSQYDMFYVRFIFYIDVYCWPRAIIECPLVSLSAERKAEVSREKSGSSICFQGKEKTLYWDIMNSNRRMFASTGRLLTVWVPFRAYGVVNCYRLFRLNSDATAFMLRSVSVVNWCFCWC